MTIAASPEQIAGLRAWGFATRQVHAGFAADITHGARITPLHLGGGAVFEDFDDAHTHFAGVEDGETALPRGNPTVSAVERKLADLEEAADAVAVASGQAALTVAFLTLLSRGDHIVSARSIYEGTRGLLREDLARLGIAVSFVPDPSGPVQLEAAIRPSTRAVFVESIPNPNNDVPDLELVAHVAHAHGAALVVDNTVATPFLLRPVLHGADVVVHSTSKFLSCHGSAIGGAVIDAGTVAGFGARARRLASRLGPATSPFNAFLLQQGIETLSLRVRRHADNALVIARWLEQHPAVASVAYSGLESSASHRNALRYLPRGQGSVFAFTLAGGEPAARHLINNVRLFSRMSHLGDLRSLILHLASTSHAHLDERERIENGALPGSVRLSVGIEDVDDLLVDLEQSLVA